MELTQKIEKYLPVPLLVLLVASFLHLTLMFTRYVQFGVKMSTNIDLLLCLIFAPLGFYILYRAWKGHQAHNFLLFVYWIYYLYFIDFFLEFKYFNILQLAVILPLVLFAVLLTVFTVNRLLLSSKAFSWKYFLKVSAISITAFLAEILFVRILTYLSAGFRLLENGEDVNSQSLYLQVLKDNFVQSDRSVTLRLIVSVCFIVSLISALFPMNISRGKRILFFFGTTIFSLFIIFALSYVMAVAAFFSNFQMI
jgi:hypothetical protein